MKAAHYIKEVKKSRAFKDFAAEDSGAYLCSLFFIRDFNGPQNETQVDFYSPKAKNIVSFKVGKGIERIPVPKKAFTITHKKFVPKPLNENIKMDLDALKPTLMDEMHNRDMTYEIEKILAILNVMDNRAVWNCTSFLKGLGLLQAHVEDQSQSVLFMEKKSLLDMMRFTGAQGAGMPGMSGMGGLPGMGGAGELGEGGGSIKVMSPQDLAAELQKEKAAAKQAEKAEKPTKKNNTEKKKEAKTK